MTLQQFLSSRVDAVVGPACSGACSAGADFLQIKDYPMISWDCTQPDLSNKPNFLRTVSDYGKVSFINIKLPYLFNKLVHIYIWISRR